MRWRFRSKRSSDTQPVALYRYWDDQNQLLYVGITNDPVRRRDQHSRHAAWWELAHGYEVEWHNNRRSALRAEANAIRRERPIFNVVHNGTNPHRVRVDRRRRQSGLYVLRNSRRRGRGTYRRSSVPVWAITTWLVLAVCAYALANELVK